MAAVAAETGAAAFRDFVVANAALEPAQGDAAAVVGDDVAFRPGRRCSALGERSGASAVRGNRHAATRSLCFRFRFRGRCT